MTPTPLARRLAPLRTRRFAFLAGIGGLVLLLVLAVTTCGRLVSTPSTTTSSLGQTAAAQTQRPGTTSTGGGTGANPTFPTAGNGPTGPTLPGPTPPSGGTGPTPRPTQPTGPQPTQPPTKPAPPMNPAPTPPTNPGPSQPPSPPTNPAPPQPPVPTQPPAPPSNPVPPPMPTQSPPAPPPNPVPTQPPTPPANPPPTQPPAQPIGRLSVNLGTGVLVCPTGLLSHVLAIPLVITNVGNGAITSWTATVDGGASISGGPLAAGASAVVTLSYGGSNPTTSVTVSAGNAATVSLGIHCIG